MEKSARIFILLFLLLGAIILFYAYQTHTQYAAETPAANIRRTLAHTLGVCTLSLSSENNGAGNPDEGTYGAMSDIPGGYCCYPNCDIVKLPDLHKDLLYKVIFIRI